MDVSVVIVSFNIKDTLKRCLDAVFQYTTDLDYEVIVVDNASTDGAIGMLKDYEKKHKNLKVIYSRENLGFSKGNNLGIKQSTGKYILLLNNDAVLLENSAKKMFGWMETHRNIGAASCLLVDSEQRISPIMSAGFFPGLRGLFAWAFFLDDLPGVVRLFKPYHIHTNGTASIDVSSVNTDLDWISGSFFFVRREVIEKVGVLDEMIFMYGEDLDWCYRIKKAGWKIGYNGETKVIHIGQASQDKIPRGYILGEFSGLKFFYAKHFSGWRQVVLGTILDVAAFNRVVFWLVRLKPQTAKIYAEALLK
ncbi:glycosyltransferase family 2 protein [Patescibacteria group bacterium]|nr:glycosyltransferase family 2 protein [Patescibacteria group bacterium]